MNQDSSAESPSVSPAEASSSERSVWASVGQGAWRFTLVSLGGFAVWAWGGRWFYRHVGEAGLYLACAVVFIGLAGWLMPAVMPGPRRGPRFLACFIPAFLAYAVAWCGFWFWLRFGAGEWLGSLAGSVAFVLVSAWRCKSYRAWPIAVVVFFVFHSLGYFVGDYFMKFTLSDQGALWFSGLSQSNLALLAKLGWGLWYGAGFGAGLGFVYHRFTSANR